VGGSDPTGKLLSMRLSVNKVDVSKLPKLGKTVNLAADDERLAFLSEQLEVEEVLEFSGSFSIKPWKMNGALMSGNMELLIRQTCVASLEPVQTQLDIDVKRYFLPETDPVFKNQNIIDGELVIDPDVDDFPDLLENTTIDVWEVVIEELNLQIDPFPRAADFNNDEVPEIQPEQDTHKPFSELKTLITEKKSKK